MAACFIWRKWLSSSLLGSEVDSLASFLLHCHIALISGGGAFVLCMCSLPGGVTSFPSAPWQIMAVLFSGLLKYITWIIHLLLKIELKSNCRTNSLPSWRLHLSGGPCRCNTAYLADAPCFIDAQRPSCTCFRRHQPDEICGMLHFTTTRQSHWHARNYRHHWAFSFSLRTFVVCHQFYRVTFGRILFMQVNTSGQMKQDVSECSPTFLSGSGFESWHYLPVEKFFADWRKNFSLTRLTHFQFSGAALWFLEPCLFKDIICTAQTRVGPS